jgi:hypothetical protein
LHDIRLRFEAKGIWAFLSCRDATFQLHINPVSKDIGLRIWNIEDLLIRVIVHKTDTVTVIVGCSFNPIAVDIRGIINLSIALARIEERLAKLIADCGAITVEGCDVSNDLLIPEHKDWIVTMWHFGADASIEYTGEKFSATWNVGQNALIRAYSKDMKRDGKTRIRLERQEYPNKSLADAIMDKLSLSSSST